MRALTATLLQLAYLRYVLASVVALAADISLFLAMNAAGMPLMLVSAGSYCAGIAVHWILSSRLVFGTALRPEGTARRQQQMLFIASALVGLATTVAVVGLLNLVGIDVRAGKVAAIAISFQLTWWLRSRIVFA